MDNQPGKQTVVPQKRRTGDVTVNRNHGGTPGTVDAAGMSLLGRLQLLFGKLQGPSVQLETNMGARAIELNRISKEAAFISRAASALPAGQQGFVLGLANNIRSVVATLKAMSAEEVQRVAAGKKTSASPSSGAPDEKQAAMPEPTDAKDIPKEKGAEAAPVLSEKETAVRQTAAQLQTWLTLLNADNFATAPAEAKRRAISMATHDVKTSMALLESADEVADVDDLMEAIDKVTDAVFAAKKMANAPTPATEVGEGEGVTADEGASSKLSLTSLTALLTEFHEALNSNQLSEIDGEVRITAVTAIAERLREIQEKLLPELDGGEESQKLAQSSVEGLLNRANRILAAGTDGVPPPVPDTTPST